jgi:hypothetical protein
MFVYSYLVKDSHMFGLSPNPSPEWEGLQRQEMKSPSLSGEGDLGGDAD